jgi:putative peptidoglycan lipid II flippase
LIVSCWGFQQILGRAFYARQDTVTPVVIGTLTTAASLPIFYSLTHLLNAVGVASASALSILLYTGALAAWWRHRFGSEAFQGLFVSTLKIAIISIVSSGLPLLVMNLEAAHSLEHPILSAFFAISLSGLCFIAAFIPLSIYFIPALIEPILKKAGPIGRRLMR